MKTLNLNIRKKEVLRIDDENKRIVEKLRTIQSIINNNKSVNDDSSTKYSVISKN